MYSTWLAGLTIYVYGDARSHMMQNRTGSRSGIIHTDQILQGAVKGSLFWWLRAHRSATL